MPTAYNRLPLGALRVFEAVASQLSFSAAAETLNVTPAAVSQQIKSLEDYLQVPLFRRDGRRVEITDEGLELLPGVRSGLEELEAALQHVKQHRRGGPLQISMLASFLQIWLLPRIRAFRRKHPETALRFHTSRDLVDFTRTPIHVALRFGRGEYPNLHVEKFLDEWMIPVAHPDLITQYGLLERDSDPERFPLLESDDEPWRVWWQLAAQREWQTRPPAIDDSAGLLAAAEEGLGYAIMRWTLVARSLQKGTLKVAGREVLPYQSSYYFVCPARYLEMPKVAQFRNWLFTVASEFPKPGAALEAAVHRSTDGSAPSSARRRSTRSQPQ